MMLLLEKKLEQYYLVFLGKGSKPKKSFAKLSFHSEFITCILAYQDCGVNFGMCFPNFFRNMLRVCFILFPSPMEAAQPGAVPGVEKGS